MVDAAVAAAAGAAIEAESQLFVNSVDMAITSGLTEVDSVFSFLEAALESGQLDTWEEAVAMAGGHAEVQVEVVQVAEASGGAGGPSS